jgi:hypothetical protein
MGKSSARRWSKRKLQVFQITKLFSQRIQDLVDLLVDHDHLLARNHALHHLVLQSLLLILNLGRSVRSSMKVDLREEEKIEALVEVEQKARMLRELPKASEDGVVSVPRKSITRMRKSILMRTIRASRVQHLSVAGDMKDKGVGNVTQKRMMKRVVQTAEEIAEETASAGMMTGEKEDAGMIMEVKGNREQKETGMPRKMERCMIQRTHTIQKQGL